VWFLPEISAGQFPANKVIETEASNRAFCEWKCKLGGGSNDRSFFGSSGVGNKNTIR
jgi:hypothetical protein